MGAAEAGCVFCSIVAGETPAHVVLDDPIARGASSTPARCSPATCCWCRGSTTRRCTDLPAELVGPLFERVQRIAGAVPAAMGAAGTFVAMNNTVSQSVPHLHVHVVPRNEGRRPARVLLAAHQVPRRRPRRRGGGLDPRRARRQAERRQLLDLGRAAPRWPRPARRARAGRPVGERPDVGQHVGARLEAEVELVEVAHHRHVEAAAVHDRTDRVVGDHARADRVERERRAGHVGDGDVEERPVAVGHLRARVEAGGACRPAPAPRTRPSRRACRRRSPSAAPSPRPCTRGSPRGARPGRRRRWRARRTSERHPVAHARPSRRRSAPTPAPWRRAGRRGARRARRGSAAARRRTGRGRRRSRWRRWRSSPPSRWGATPTV